MMLTSGCSAMPGSLQGQGQSGSMIPKGASVDVAVCTYRRSSLETTLRSLAAQRLPAATRLRVIVADNDETPSARELVERLIGELGLDLLYVHAPARNISVARNACLAAARAPLLAFIDDDEEASPTWLANLLRRLDATGADVVFGPVDAIYQDEAPRWIQTADLHSIRPVDRPGRGIETGYSCNVLLRRERLDGLTFDPALGRSGGEDTVFFHRMRANGASLDYAPDALVTEIVPAPRARLEWLVRRSFRTGQTHARILKAQGRSRLGQAMIASGKVSYCAAQTALGVFSTERRNRALVRGALHCGVVATLLGFADLQLY